MPEKAEANLTIKKKKSVGYHPKAATDPFYLYYIFARHPVTGDGLADYS
jgi:hypothetical protein